MEILALPMVLSYKWILIHNKDFNDTVDWILEKVSKLMQKEMSLKSKKLVQ